MDDLQWLDHLADLACNRYSVVRVGLGQVKPLDAFIFGLVTVRDAHLALSEDRLQVMDHPAFQGRHMRCILQRKTSLCLHVWEAKLRCCLLPFALVAGMAGQGEVASPSASSP